MAYVEKRESKRTGTTKYRGKYRDDRGKPHSGKWVDTEKEALNWAKDQESLLRRGEWHDDAKARITLTEYFEKDWLPERRYAVNTRKYYENIFNACMRERIGDKELRALTRPVIQRWVNAMDDDIIEPGTVKARFKALQTILAAQKGVSAVGDGLLKENPCKGVDLPHVPEREVTIYTVEESRQLCRALGKWWAPLPMLASLTGLRWGELMGLTVGDFDWSGEVTLVKVHRTIIEVSQADSGNGTSWMWTTTPKGKRNRTVALDSEASVLVRRLIRERGLFEKTDRLFSPPSGKLDGLPLRTDEWPEGRPVFRGTFADYWERAHAETMIEKNNRSFHSLRGSHLSWLLAGGADLLTVMDRAGHRNVETTQAYLQAMPDKHIRALDALKATQDRSRPTIKKARPAKLRLVRAV